jgi:di/tricarboxylate transporter
MNQTIVFITLTLALGMFAWGRFRHDLVALGALLLLVISGVVPADTAFSGFSNPAVISVAAILVVSEALRKSGFVEYISKFILRLGTSLALQIFVLSSMVCLTSAFMNNIGALAIFMPVAIHITRKSGHAASSILMPLAFASLLGGMMTMIGTPPNILISAFRSTAVGSPFGIFAFTPVGSILALLGISFITGFGWRFLPRRNGEADRPERFNIHAYITEVRVPAGSPLIGMAIKEITARTANAIRVLSLVRTSQRKPAGRLLSRLNDWLAPFLGAVPKLKTLPPADEEIVLREHDVLVIESDAASIKEFMHSNKVILVGDASSRGNKGQEPERERVAEVVVLPDSPLAGKSASETRMRARYGVSLLAVARQDRRLIRRIDRVEFHAGDVLLLKGHSEMLDERIVAMGCLPLADRGLSIEKPRTMALAIGIFGMAIILVVTEALPLQLAFTLAAILVVGTGVLPVQEMWSSVDWPVIVLLGALLPLGQALETSGGVTTIATLILRLGAVLPTWGLLGIMISATMLLSAVVNNAATVVLMAPVAISIAGTLGASADPFLMAIAVGASSSFLTPIAHQSNTLVMGPGGYKFTDYLRLGLPLSILVCCAAVPAIMLLWPL